MRVNTTIDDTSPLIAYSATHWVAGLQTDTYWTEYSGGTYAVSATRGATATFSFNGTGVWLFGAFRADHGLYNVTLDGVTTNLDGFRPGHEFFQYVLGGSGGLENGIHTISLVNDARSAGRANLDLDHIIWESEIGGENDQISDKVEQDNESGFQYLPAATAWSTTPENLSLYSGNTGHMTVSASGAVSYTFTGEAVSIFGAIGPAQGPYAVSVDGGSPQILTAKNPQFIPQSLLFRKDGLGGGQHVITISNQPSAPGEGLSIDYAVVTTATPPPDTSTVAASGSSTTSSTTSTISTETQPTSIPGVAPPNEDSQPKGLGTGAIVGTIAGVLALLGLLFAVLVIRKRRKAARDARNDPDMVVIPDPYPGGDSGSRYVPPSAIVGAGYGALHSGPPSLQSHHHHQNTSSWNQDNYYHNDPVGVPQVVNSSPSIFSGVEPSRPPASSMFPNPMSTIHSIGDQAALERHDSTRTHTSVLHSGVLQTSQEPAPPLPTNPGVIPPRKGQVTLPTSASVQQAELFNQVDPNTLAQTRMNVEGRPQDFGPLVETPEVSQDLPPDYTQATEVLQR